MGRRNFWVPGEKKRHGTGKRSGCLLLKKKKLSARNFLVMQWLGFCAFTAKGPGSTPGQGTKIQQAAWSKQKQNKMKQKPPPLPTESLSGYPKCADFGGKD